jgi:hypothetical protein
MNDDKWIFYLGGNTGFPLYPPCGGMPLQSLPRSATSAWPARGFDEIVIFELYNLKLITRFI